MRSEPFNVHVAPSGFEAEHEQPHSAGAASRPAWPSSTRSSYEPPHALLPAPTKPATGPVQPAGTSRQLYPALVHFGSSQSALPSSSSSTPFVQSSGDATHLPSAQSPPGQVPESGACLHTPSHVSSVHGS